MTKSGNRHHIHVWLVHEESPYIQQVLGGTQKCTSQDSKMTRHLLQNRELAMPVYAQLSLYLPQFHSEKCGNQGTQYLFGINETSLYSQISMHPAMLATCVEHCHDVPLMSLTRSLCCQDIHDKIFQYICKELLSLISAVLWVHFIISLALPTTHTSYTVSILLSMAHDPDALVSGKMHS